jgi:hypothetical protein
LKDFEEERLAQYFLSLGAERGSYSLPMQAGATMLNLV